MEGFTSFLANNYIWFLIISLILLFALIGYLVDVKDIKTGRRDKKPKEELKIIDFSTVDQSKSLNDSIKEEKNELNLDEYSKKNEDNNANQNNEQVSTEQLNNIGESNTADSATVSTTPTEELKVETTETKEENK